MQFPTSAGEQCVEIPIIDDSIALEGDEIFIVEFDSNQLPDDVKPGPVNFTTVSIIDDDGKFGAISKKVPLHSVYTGTYITSFYRFFHLNFRGYSIV